MTTLWAAAWACLAALVAGLVMTADPIAPVLLVALLAWSGGWVSSELARTARDR